MHNSCPALTVAPSSTSLFSMIPLTGEGTATAVYNNMKNRKLIYIDSFPINTT